MSTHTSHNSFQPQIAGSTNSLLQFLDEAKSAADRGRIDEATHILAQAAEYLVTANLLTKNDANLWKCFGTHLIFTGEMTQQFELLQKMVKMVPWSAQLHSLLLLNLHHLSEMAQQMIFDEHKRWASIHAPADKAQKNHNNLPDPDRKLRVGYISPDFHTHAVAFFFESLLDGHNRKNVEVYGYGNVRCPDQITERMKRKFDHYRNIYSVDDDAVVAMIKQDRVDILVDLAGHTNNNRLGVMAYKPAPIQATYLGYPNTTGMQQIDYRLTDTLSNLPESQEFYTEQLVFLPGVLACYRPHDFDLPVTPLPAERNGYITFGSFKNNCKINPKVLSLWAEVLKANDNSRFLLRFARANDQAVISHYLRQFQLLGIPPERVQISGWRDLAEHLRLYAEVDIALDTFPFNGHTTTCDALWMGVPTISLVGKCHPSRLGLTILNSVGLEFFAVSTPEEYLSKATALAANRRALAKIRASMRQRIASSELCDSKRFAGCLEDAYRKMWRRWCQSRSLNTRTEQVGPEVNSNDKRIVLNVGCGSQRVSLSPGDWQEIRLDIDPSVKPDIVNDMTDMKDVENESVDAVWSSHNLEHLYAHQVSQALSEFYRVLKTSGTLYLRLPDIQTVAEKIAQGDMEGPLYQSPAGPISPVDIMWGHQSSIADGNHHMAHKTGFTAAALKNKLAGAGFEVVKIERIKQHWELHAVARKGIEDSREK